MKNNTKNLILVIFAIFIRPIGISLASPSLPHIQKYFNSPIQESQLIIVFFVLAAGITQLFYGTLSDKYNRKTVFNIGILIFSISSFCSIFAETIHQLLIFRIIQGIGLGCEFSISSSMIKDISGINKKLAWGYSLSEFTCGLSLILLPFIGGFTQEFLGWKANFILMGLFTLVIFILFELFYIDTSKKDPTINLKKSFMLYKKLSLDRTHVIFTLIISILTCFFYVFYTEAPFIIETKLKHTAAFYGIISLSIGLIYIIGVGLNSLLLKYLKIRTIIMIGIFIFTFNSCLMVILSFSNIFNLYSFIVPCILISFSIGLIFANSHAIAVSNNKDIAGTTNAYIGFSYFIIVSFVTWLLSLITFSNYFIIISIFYFVFSALLCSLFFFSFRVIKEKV